MRDAKGGVLPKKKTQKPLEFDHPETVRRDLAEARAFFSERPELWMTPAYALLLHAERELARRQAEYEFLQAYKRGRAEMAA